MIPDLKIHKTISSGPLLVSFSSSSCSPKPGLVGQQPGIDERHPEFQLLIQSLVQEHVRQRSPPKSSWIDLGPWCRA
ncbi:hypothetical protein BDW72DRAFT_163713 [Aspergillus terricola var. indicus]